MVINGEPVPKARPIDSCHARAESDLLLSLVVGRWPGFF